MAATMQNMPQLNGDEHHCEKTERTPTQASEMTPEDDHETEAEIKERELNQQIEHSKRLGIKNLRVKHEEELHKNHELRADLAKFEEKFEERVENEVESRLATQGAGKPGGSPARAQKKPATQSPDDLTKQEKLDAARKKVLTDYRKPIEFVGFNIDPGVPVPVKIGENEDAEFFFLVKGTMEFKPSPDTIEQYENWHPYAIEALLAMCPSSIEATNISVGDLASVEVEHRPQKSAMEEEGDETADSDDSDSMVIYAYKTVAPFSIRCDKARFFIIMDVLKKINPAIFQMFFNNSAPSASYVNTIFNNAGILVDYAATLPTWEDHLRSDLLRAFNCDNVFILKQKVFQAGVDAAQVTHLPPQVIHTFLMGFVDKCAKNPCIDVKTYQSQWVFTLRDSLQLCLFENNGVKGVAVNHALASNLKPTKPKKAGGKKKRKNEEDIQPSPEGSTNGDAGHASKKPHTGV